MITIVWCISGHFQLIIGINSLRKKLDRNIAKRMILSQLVIFWEWRRHLFNNKRQMRRKVLYLCECTLKIINLAKYGIDILSFLSLTFICYAFILTLFLLFIGLSILIGVIKFGNLVLQSPTILSSIHCGILHFRYWVISTTSFSPLIYWM